MKYLIPILSIGAGSLLISCGNGDSTPKTESPSQSTQDHVKTEIDSVSEVAILSDSTSRLSTDVDKEVIEVGGISEKEAKQILRNYDPENEKFRLAELERRRRLALVADPTLNIPDPQQVIANEKAKYRNALEVQKKVKASQVKSVKSEAKTQITDSNIKTVANKPEPESKPVFQKVVNTDSYAPKTHLESTKPEPAQPQVAQSETTQTAVSKPELKKPELKQPTITETAATVQAIPPAQETSKPKTSGVAKINFDQMTFSFDTIVEGDIIDYKFKFVNTGTRPIEILNAKASCGCTRPSFPFLPIEPGQEGYIGVKYDSRTKSGNQTPEIEVVTNFQDDPIKLYLKGFVKEKAKEKEGKK